MLVPLALIPALMATATPPKHHVKAIPGLKIKDVKVGKGAAAVAGDTVTVNYTGKLTNGTVFDTSLKPGRGPFQLRLGAGMVIKGWDLGLVGMKAGGKRILTIAPELAYGSTPPPGSGIAPNSTLIFIVDMVKIEH